MKILLVQPRSNSETEIFDIVRNRSKVPPVRTGSAPLNPLFALVAYRAKFQFNEATYRYSVAHRRQDGSCCIAVKSPLAACGYITVESSSRGPHGSCTYSSTYPYP